MTARYHYVCAPIRASGASARAGSLRASHDKQDEQGDNEIKDKSDEPERVKYYFLHSVLR